MTEISYKLEMFERSITPGPWRATADGITQTRHVTRDVWYIPKSEVDREFIAYVRNNLPEIIEAIRERGSHDF